MFYRIPFADVVGASVLSDVGAPLRLSAWAQDSTAAPAMCAALDVRRMESKTNATA
jgi:hypothetical protein